MWEQLSFSAPYLRVSPIIRRLVDIADQSSEEMDDGLVLNIAEDASSAYTKASSKKSGRWTDR